MVAPNYAKARSDLAKRMGLGRKSAGGAGEEEAPGGTRQKRGRSQDNRRPQKRPAFRGVSVFVEEIVAVYFSSSASSVISAPLKSFETGQPALASSAAFLNSASDMPGTRPFRLKR